MKSTKTIGPSGAIEYRNEANFLHREDGPAWSQPNGYQEWRINGRLHREDGPAMIYPDGEERWWLNGIRHTHEKWLYLLSIEYKWKEFCGIN